MKNLTRRSFFGRLGALVATPWLATKSSGDVESAPLPESDIAGPTDGDVVTWADYYSGGVQHGIAGERLEAGTFVAVGQDGRVYKSQEADYRALNFTVAAGQPVAIDVLPVPT